MDTIMDKTNDTLKRGHLMMAGSAGIASGIIAWYGINHLIAVILVLLIVPIVYFVRCKRFPPTKQSIDEIKTIEKR